MTQLLDFVTNFPVARLLINKISSATLYNRTVLPRVDLNKRAYIFDDQINPGLYCNHDRTSELIKRTEFNPGLITNTNSNTKKSTKTTTCLAGILR